MTDELSWHVQGQTLILQGELDRDTLPALWLQRQELLDGIKFLDVSGLKRVDSAGVALMLHFYHHQQHSGVTLVLTGVTDRLHTLISLYKLQAILPCSSSVSVKSIIPTALPTPSEDDAEKPTKPPICSDK